MNDRKSKKAYVSRSETVRTRSTTEGVDAQNANEYDIEHGLAGIEAKPCARANVAAEKRARNLHEEREHPAFSAEPSNDPNQHDPH